MTTAGEPMGFLIDGLTHLGVDDPCPTWPYATTPAGYPLVSENGTVRLVCHIVLERTGRGARLLGMEACHSCGNGAAGCWHPGHLRWDTHAANMRDAVAAGLNQGERHGMSKLTEKQVRAIRASVGSHAAVAREYGIARRTVSDIRNRTTWSHLP